MQTPSLIFETPAPHALYSATHPPEFKAKSAGALTGKNAVTLPIFLVFSPIPDIIERNVDLPTDSPTLMVEDSLYCNITVLAKDNQHRVVINSLAADAFYRSTLVSREDVL